MFFSICKWFEMSRIWNRKTYFRIEYFWPPSTWSNDNPEWTQILILIVYDLKFEIFSLTRGVYLFSMVVGKLAYQYSILYKSNKVNKIDWVCQKKDWKFHIWKQKISSPKFVKWNWMSKRIEVKQKIRIMYISIPTQPLSISM